MSFLDDLRDSAGRQDGPPGVWLLVPGDPQEPRPMIDGKPVPVFTAAQWGKRSLGLARGAARRRCRRRLAAPLTRRYSKLDRCRHDRALGT